MAIELTIWIGSNPMLRTDAERLSTQNEENVCARTHKTQQSRLTLVYQQPKTIKTTKSNSETEQRVLSGFFVIKLYDLYEKE